MTDEITSTTNTWQEVWKKALVHPSVKTFTDLSNDPTVSDNRAYKWLFMGWLISFLSPLVCAPFIAAIAVICTAIYILLINYAARCLKGTGTYKQLIFVTAAYSAPLAIINGFITYRDEIIPFSGYLLLLLSLYGLILSVIAVKAVYQFSWLKALIANLLPPMILIGGIVLAVAVPNRDALMTALKNRDFSQFFSNEELPVMQEWPSTIDKDLPIIKVDELISLIKGIDDSIEFKESTSWRQIGDRKYDTYVHYCTKKFGEVDLMISLTNRLEEDKLEQLELSIIFPEGEFKLHEEKITSLSKKYISGLVTQLVKEPGKACYTAFIRTPPSVPTSQDFAKYYFQNYGNQLG
ncbi:MAG: YIP1 family protein [Candidatus Electrothrix sp. GM3_4]|nr:YIP1 family protein [Candidatus Electrothrix sp. GM3_4]